MKHTASERDPSCTHANTRVSLSRHGTPYRVPIQRLEVIPLSRSDHIPVGVRSLHLQSTKYLLHSKARVFPPRSPRVCREAQPATLCMPRPRSSTLVHSPHTQETRCQQKLDTSTLTVTHGSHLLLDARAIPAAADGESAPCRDRKKKKKRENRKKKKSAADGGTMKTSTLRLSRWMLLLFLLDARAAWAPNSGTRRRTTTTAKQITQPSNECQNTSLWR